MSTKPSYLSQSPTNPSQALFALIEAASIVFIEGRQVMVIEVPPVLLDYLAVFGADDAEFEIDDWSEDDDPLEDDDPNGPSDLEYGD